MKDIWNQRAKKDAFYYVESAFWDGDIDKFFALGEERSQLILDPILKGNEYRYSKVSYS